MYFKPLGYPGDYEMMRMLREDSFEGPNLFAKMVNKAFLETPLGRANRNRVEYLAERIGSFVEEKEREEVRVLSIASGPALEIQQLIERRPDVASRIHLTLLDQEAEALRYSQDAIYMKRILHGASIQVELIHQSIGSFLKQLARRCWHKLKFDLVYIFGLFDYFDDRTCSFCIKHSADLVDEGGTLLISNYSLDGHEHHTYLEYAFEWYMLYRNKEQMEKLGRSTGLPCELQVDQDPSGVIKFLELRFDKGNRRGSRRPTRGRTSK
jgi:extracellular factor (EF) 3-hydroxypalmitic acid methyl ester biosynthesis protein